VPKPNVPTVATQEQSAKPKQKPGLKQVTLDRTFAQVIKGKKQEQTKEAKTDATSQTLQKILAKLEEQDKTNKMILERLIKLESSNKKSC
jgi:hypothetical protein